MMLQRYEAPIAELLRKTRQMLREDVGVDVYF
jgi:hypothetical protein